VIQLNSESVTLITAPASEPVSTSEAKSHLRVDISDDDTLIAALIVAAREIVELYTGQSYIQRTYRADLADFSSAIHLPRGPVTAISSVKYYDTSSPETLTTWAASNYYLHKDIWRKVEGVSFPSVGSRADNVQITYTAGWLDESSPRAASTPTAIKQAMLLLIGDLYENRERQLLYPGQLLTGSAYESLLNPYRVYR